MDLDWCNDAELKTTTPFNDESIIVSKYKIVEEKKEQPVEKKKDNINVDDCFNIKTECTNGDELLNVLYYLSGVSNHLRNLISLKWRRLGAPVFDQTTFVRKAPRPSAELHSQ